MDPVRARRRSIAASAAAGVLLGIAGVAGPVLAHGSVPSDPPTVGSLLLGWTFAPLPTLGIAVAAGWWLWAVRQVDARHPANPVPRRRTVGVRGCAAGARVRAGLRHRAL